MIELIFAITIMGIVLMSAPMLVSRSVQSSFTALQQESIAAASAQISMIMTAAWDHNDANTTIGMPVLLTDSGTGAVSPLIVNCTTDAPVGVSSSSGRYCKNIGMPFYWASHIALDSAYEDIDDFNGLEGNVTLYNSESYDSSRGDYIDKNVKIAVSVSYGDDVPRNAGGGLAGGYKKNTTFSNPFRTSTTATTSNIKLISVTLTSNSPSSELSNKNITLSAFMCNIGAPKDLISNKAGL